MKATDFSPGDYVKYHLGVQWVRDDDRRMPVVQETYVPARVVRVTGPRHVTIRLGMRYDDPRYADHRPRSVDPSRLEKW